MHYVYLIQNDVTGELYIGYTTSPTKRLQEHNAKGKKYTTRLKGEWKYVYLEVFRSKDDAMLREKRLKSHASGKHELLKRLGKSLLSLKSGEGRSESFSANCLPKTQLPANS